MNAIKAIILSDYAVGSVVFVVGDIAERQDAKYTINRIEQAHLAPDEGINRWFFVYGVLQGSEDNRDYMLNAFNPRFVVCVEYFVEDPPTK